MSKRRPSAVVNALGKPTEPVLKLLDLLGLSHDGSLSSVVAVTQEKFIQRKEGGERKERWELEEVSSNLRAQVMSHLDQLGMLQEVKPRRRRSFEYALLLGALVTRVRSRLRYLADLWRQGIRYKKLVFLSGKRSLAESGKETPNILLDSNNTELPFRPDWQPPSKMPTTELEMIIFVWEQANLPEDMRESADLDGIVLINARMKPNPSGGAPLWPTTEDTINMFCALKLPPGPCLAISNQPHVGYQHSVLTTCLSPTFPVTTVGHAASRELTLAFYLGELARWLYQEQKQDQMRGNPPS